MNIVAVAVTASLSLSIAGCALDKSVDGSAADPGAAQQSRAERPARLTVAAAPSAAGNTEQAAADAVPAPGDAAAAPPARPAGDETVRDAKEATEEAARKIFDAAVGAATKIKEVGRGAVRAVRDSNARDKDDHDEHAKLDDSLAAAQDAAAADMAGD